MTDPRNQLVLAQSPLFPAHQGLLWCRKTLREMPQQTPSADSLGEAEVEDGQVYFLKGDAHGRRVRASEWICTHLAERVGIPAPNCAAIQMLDNTVVFGSRKLCGSANVINTAAYLLSANGQTSSGSVVGLDVLLSSIYALDMFLYNDDRHLGNFLIVPDGQVCRLHAFDFSRSLFWSWPLSGFPPVHSNTVRLGRVLRKLHPFSIDAADRTLNLLSALSDVTLGSILEGMPVDWMGADILPPLVEWWSSVDRQDRISILRAGLTDGSLL